jgi:hydroxyacylglutathione hydrolase
MFDVIPIPAFRDNYIWLLVHQGHAVVVDPGDAEPVAAVLKARQLNLEAILVTHHHSDHIDGIASLTQQFPTRVFAPAKENFPFPHPPVQEADVLCFPGIEAEFLVMETPGHTLGHVVYYGANSLFCGDTLFGCGCGRLFEGTCEQLYSALQRLAELPPETRVYPAHEYTEHNIHFAMTLEPQNNHLLQRAEEVASKRALGLPSLPSTIGLERETNPFMRCSQLRLQNLQPNQDPASVFCHIRTLRNYF